MNAKKWNGKKKNNFLFYVAAETILSVIQAGHGKLGHLGAEKLSGGTCLP